ncbi:MAG: ABC transporter ATP-binding protein [Oscillospiraceae bacterium]|nr:ABC transporter ATP-binding protein [Oscillospiraceae bacterium]
MGKSEKLLSVRDIYVEYTQGKNVIHAVNGVSFDLERGEILGLVGETGAGKTTIARAILRILPVPPAIFRSGNILLDGEELMELPENDMRNIRGSKISMIFQDPMTALNPLMTVGDQIVEALQLHNKDMTLQEAVARASEMLELVGIPMERFVEYPHQFSGGMKQRVVIAMALSCDPELLLADEPTTALDVTIQAQVLDLIKNLQQQYNTSMILITHDLGVVAETCDRVAVIYAGEIVEMADKYELFKHPLHPYTNGLFASLPDMAAGKARLNPIEGLPPDPSSLPQGCKFHPRCKFATELCKQEVIPMTEAAPGHYCRCCHVQESAADGIFSGNASDCH